MNGVSREVLKTQVRGEPGLGQERDICHLFRVEAPERGQLCRGVLAPASLVTVAFVGIVSILFLSFLQGWEGRAPGQKPGQPPVFCVWP